MMIDYVWIAATEVMNVGGYPVRELYVAVENERFGIVRVGLHKVLPEEERLARTAEHDCKVK